MAAKTVPGGIVIVILFAFVVFFILPTLQLQPTFDLEFESPRIAQGETTKLFVSVANNENEPLKDVNLTFQSDLELGHETVSLNEILPSLGVRYSLFVSTRNLPVGNYPIDVTLNYTTSKTTVNKTQRIVLEIYPQPTS